MRSLFLSLLAFPSLALLGGCVPPVDHPSLAPRPIEDAAREAFRSPSRAHLEAGPIVADPVIEAKVAALAQAARAGTGETDRAIEAARQLVDVVSGSHATPGSEAWVSAEQAVSRAEASRNMLVQRLADLDRLRIDLGGAAPAALDTALAELGAVDARQRAALAELGGRLSPP